MADNIFEMTRSLGQTRYTRFDETHDNENPVDQISEACVKLLSVAEVAERRQIPSIRIGRCVRLDPRALEETLRSPGWAR